MTSGRVGHGRLDEWAQQLYSAVVSDSCDRAGLRNQAALPGLRPLASQNRVLVGFARPVLAEPVSAIPQRPYAAEVAYVDSLVAGDVVVAATNGSASAFWGELFSTAATARGARGAVVNGLVRDQLKIAQLGFQVFAAGARPADSLGRLSIVGQDEPIDFMGVQVARGDLVVADTDGIVIVPAAHLEEVIAFALDKASTEDQARELLLNGGKLADVWEQFRVL